MKKILKITFIVIICIIVLLLIMFIYLSNRPFVENDYYKKVETGGKIEAKYMENGIYDVSYYEESAMQGFKKYEIYYPAELSGVNRKYPVVVFVNGSGARVSKYSALLEHMASWGFIAIGTEEEWDWNGFAAEMCIRHLIRLSQAETVNDKDNIFKGKIDLDNVGITGHSQGGAGVFNAITVQEHRDIFKAAVALSPTNRELAQILEWDYDAAKISIPVMLISGAGGGDDWVVTGEQLNHIFEDINASKVMIRRKNTAHGAVLYSADGYVTAWFMWLLQGDEEAGTAFSGDCPEIISNGLYQDQRSDFKKSNTPQE